MKEKFGNILIAFFLIALSSWTLYESAKELKETIRCNLIKNECIYTKGCPFLTPSYTNKFYLHEISLDRHKRLIKSSRGKMRIEIDNFIITPREHLKVSDKVFSKLTEYKQNPIGNLFYQNYQIGLIPLCILFFIIGISFLRTSSNNSSSAKYKTPSDFYIREIDKYIEFFDSKLFTNLIGKKIKSSFRKYKQEYDKNTLYLKEDGTTNVNNVRISVCSIVIEMVEGILLSGNYHLYRGVLSEEGKGIMQIWDLMMQKYLELNPKSEDNIPIDDNWVKIQRDKLLNEIKNIG